MGGHRKAFEVLKWGSRWGSGFLSSDWGTRGAVAFLERIEGNRVGRNRWVLERI